MRMGYIKMMMENMAKRPTEVMIERNGKGERNGKNRRREGDEESVASTQGGNESMALDVVPESGDSDVKGD